MATFSEHICYALCRYLLSRRHLGRYEELTHNEVDVQKYDQWRVKALEKQLTAFRGQLNGKTVVDFGCGGGMLSKLLIRKGARKVYGIEINPEILETLKANFHNPDSLEFLQGGQSSIPLEDSSVDHIFCISVLEHVMDVDSILMEWYRILRPGGSVFIGWTAWHHPDASHLTTVIPIPYSQCLFSEKTLSRTAARLKKSSVYTRKFWESTLDHDLPDDLTSERYTDGFLNKMTIAQFNHKLRTRTSFLVSEHTCHPPAWLPLISPLLKVSFFREHLTSFASYNLTKPKTNLC